MEGKSCLKSAWTGEGGGKGRFGRLTAPLGTEEANHESGREQRPPDCPMKAQESRSEWPSPQVTRPLPHLQDDGTFLQKKA